jgi:hypothetical protein
LFQEEEQLYRLHLVDPGWIWHLRPAVRRTCPYSMHHLVGYEMNLI